MNTLWEAIKYYREKKKISKSELARRIGVSPAYISMLESGDKKRPSLEILSKISSTLDVPLEELLSLRDVIPASEFKLENLVNSYFKKNNKDKNITSNVFSQYMYDISNPYRTLLKNSFCVDTDLLTDKQIEEIISAIRFTIKLKLEEFNHREDK